MKDLLIIVGTILLGCFIFHMIAGDRDSLKSAGEKWMRETVKMYEEL